MTITVLVLVAFGALPLARTGVEERAPGTCER